MGRIVPYLSVSSAIDALDLYEKIFDAEVKERMPVGEEQSDSFNLPDDVDLSKTTMHGAFEIVGELLYISDNFTGKTLDNVNVSILVNPESLDQIKTMYQRAEENDCEITMELEKQFWGDYFASFTDPFGIAWQLNYSPEDGE